MVLVTGRGIRPMSKVLTTMTCLVVLALLTVGSVSFAADARRVGATTSAEVLADGRIVGDKLASDELAGGRSHHSGNQSEVKQPDDVAVSVDAALVQMGSGAQWSIKLPPCPEDLEICCAFFTNWNWGTWAECGEEVLFVGKALVSKALELLDYLTDPKKLAKWISNSPMSAKFWQMFEWGKKAMVAFKEAFENIVEGLTKVVMAIVRLIVGMMKIPSCWSLDSNRNEWTAFGGGFKGTDCGAMASLKKIQVWGFMTDLGNCFIHLSQFPATGTVMLPTPFLTTKEVPFCVYHIPPIVRQLIDGILQIAKAIVILVVDLVTLGLEMIDIIAGSLFTGTALEAVVKSGPKLRAAAQRLLNGDSPDPPEGGTITPTSSTPATPTTPPASSLRRRAVSTLRRRAVSTLRRRAISALRRRVVSALRRRYISSLRRRYISSLRRRYRRIRSSLLESQHEEHGSGDKTEEEQSTADETEEEQSTSDEVEDDESGSVFRAMFARELSTLEDSVSTSSDHILESSHLELARESEEAERVIRQLVTQHQAVHPSAWEDVLGSSSLLDSQDAEEEDDGLVQKWLVSMAGKLDVDAMLESTVASMLAEDSVGNVDRLGYYFKVGGNVDCNMQYAKFAFLTPNLLLGAFLIPILDPTLNGGVGMTFSLGRTSNLNGGKFSIGVTMGFAIAAQGTLDLFRLWNSWTTVLAGIAGKMGSIKLCDNWGRDLFSIAIIPAGMLGAMCAPLTVAKGKILSFLGGGLTLPKWGFDITMPLVIQGLAQVIGLPVDKVPGDLLSITVGWMDFKDTADAWYFGIGINPLPSRPDPTTMKPPTPPSPLVVVFTMGASWTYFLGIPCGPARARSLLATNLRSSVRARMEATCTKVGASAGGVGNMPSSCVGSRTGAAGLARCVQESASARLSCGSGAHLEALGHMSSSSVAGEEDIASITTPVVDRTLHLQFHGDGAGSLPVRIVAGWVSGLSSLRVVDTEANAASATSVSGGVRSTMSLASQSDIQLRAVCLQWDATAAKNAFRPITGAGHSTRQRARQMASAMEAKLHQDSGSVDSAEHARIASWVNFVKAYDAARPEAATLDDEPLLRSVNIQWASELAGDKGSVKVGAMATQKCFKVRIGGVRAHLDTSVSTSSIGEDAKGAFVGTSAELHSFTLSTLSSSLETGVAQSPALVQAVADVLGSFEESSAATEVVQSALRSTIAAQLVSGTQAALERSMCASLQSVVCPSCESEHVDGSASWREQCSSVTARGASPAVQQLGQ